MGGMCVGALDQGTTGTRFIVFDGESHPLGAAYETHEQRYPRPGWVEHDPIEIWENTKAVIEAGLRDAGVGAADLSAVGITNQRETVVLWEADTGRPVHDAIVWQDRRTADRVDELREAGLARTIRERTGLEPDAYFSATKVEWLLKHVDDGAIRQRAIAGELRFGTIDTWLIDRLTGEHVTDVTNASRTMLYDIDRGRWDPDLLETFDIPREILPTVRPSIDDKPYGMTDPNGTLEAAVPVAAALGDQQAALFGQTCFERGEAKNTYGTGSFFLLNTGTERVASEHGLLTTIAYEVAGESTCYALEGSIFVTGAAVEWLADVGLVADVDEVERLARSVDEPGDIYLVPAFTGLGAPHWDQRARGALVGLTRDTSRADIARATLEAIGYQTRDVAEAMAGDADTAVSELSIDGGAVRNDLLCQLQADILGTTVKRPRVQETTALGAAYAAGLVVGLWDSRSELREQRQVDATFEPTGDPEAIERRYARWGDAVARAKGWATD